MAKKVKVKLPKRVAGMKIPKVVRKGALGEFLNSGAGQVILAETLVAAAAMFTAAKADGARRLGNLADAGADHSHRLAKACKAASHAFREALHEDAATWEEVPEPPAKSAKSAKTKKKSSARSAATTH
ncbi:MAG: hypothetical protein V4628_08745 [Pseudomonadota bacterium]